MYNDQQVVAIIPARDEASSIAKVVSAVRQLGHQIPLFDRVLVCDNASIDDTAIIARKYGAEVIHQSQPGYGIACLTALGLIEQTDIVVFIDADASLDIGESISLLKAIDTGADLAVGRRIKAWQQTGSMTLPQQFGNYLASRLIRLIWQIPVHDLGPFRAIRFEALQQLDMQDTAFGWTVEMQVKAIQHELSMIEVPVHYYRRTGHSKISGTIYGVIGAGVGIFSTIFKLALNPSRTVLQAPKPPS